MKAWLENLVGPDYATALLWTVVALIVLLVLLVAIRIVRAFSVGTFISGGRQRKTRLAVMDATAVDSHRRLVLVRRDDVEHLILIGGPSDVVVEQNIRMAAPARRPAVEDGHAQRAPEPAPSPAPAYQQPTAAQPPRAEPAAPRPTFTPPAPPVAPTPVAAPAPAPMRAPSPAPIPAPMPVPPPAAQPRPAVQPMRPVVTQAPAPAAERPVKADLDDALLRELEVSLDKEIPSPAAPRVEAAPAADSLDEEMSKLLRDLAGNKQ